MSDLTLYNSLKREKETFTPIDPSHVRLYACGPTVYNYAHIGNARMAVVFDVLTRVLRQLYPEVTYVSNITDVDDKIMKAAEDTGTPIDEITKKYADIYNADMAALGCSAPDIQPRATTHIGEMIALIEKLIEQDHAYASDGHVLFHVPSFPAYGGLSGRSRDEQIAGARVEVASYKKDPADFVLWKPSAENEPGWDSPWGRGRPGWHIECSAMAEKHLGLPFDIHGGGADLKFPHHENEIAQSCCAHGHEDDLSAFAKMWVHNGFVTVEGEKMSKSLGNVTLVHDLIEGKPKHYGMVLRLALLSAHYRKPLDWSAQAIHQAEKLYGRITKVYDALENIDIDPFHKKVDEGVMNALFDDLNTPMAFSRLNVFLGELHHSASDRKVDHSELAILKSVLHNSLVVLGVDPSFIKYGQASMSVSAQMSAKAQKVSVLQIERLLEERAEARAAKNFARSDEIRDQLKAMGVVIEDTPEGAKWRWT